MIREIGYSRTTDGKVKDQKGYSGDGTLNGVVVVTPGILYQYTQTLGVRLPVIDGTITDKTLGTFTVTHYRSGTITYTTTVQ